jgi:hypothetical protein
MSIFKKTVAVQGEVLVERDSAGTVTRRASPPEKGMPPLRNWRRQVRQMTDNGIDAFKVLINIMNAQPQKITLPDGKESEWIIPTLETQRAAAKDIIEFINGKAVAQTEVMKAEKEAEDVEQYQAMSDEALRAAALPFLERAQKKLNEGEE